MKTTTTYAGIGYGVIFETTVYLSPGVSINEVVHVTRYYDSVKLSSSLEKERREKEHEKIMDYIVDVFFGVVFFAIGFVAGLLDTPEDKKKIVGFFMGIMMLALYYLIFFSGWLAT